MLPKRDKVGFLREKRLTDRHVTDTFLDGLDDPARLELVNVFSRQQLEADLRVVRQVLEFREASPDPGVDRRRVGDEAFSRRLPEERAVGLSE